MLHTIKKMMHEIDARVDLFGDDASHRPGMRLLRGKRGERKDREQNRLMHDLQTFP